MATTNRVLHAVAARIAAGGHGAWDPGGRYASTQTGIVLKVMPPTPDRAIVIAAYPLEGSPDPADTVRTFAVQVRTRLPGNPPTDVDDLAEDIRDTLTSHHTWWGGVFVQRCYRISTAQLGADTNGRQERSDNYRLITDR